DPSLALSTVTLAPCALETHMLAPSKATRNAEEPTLNAPRTAPSLALISVRVLLVATQMLAPSKTRPVGEGVGIVDSIDPSLALSFITELSKRLVTQMFAPSKANAPGAVPTLKVPRDEPSLALSFVTVLSIKFATHILAPSKTGADGIRPTLKVPSNIPSLAR